MSHSFAEPENRPRAVLAAVQLPDQTDEQIERSLAELGRLCDTLGLEVVARVTQRRPTLGSPIVFGAGKLRELARLTGGGGAVPSPVPAWKRRRGSAGEDESDAGGPADDPFLDEADAELVAAEDTDPGEREGEGEGDEGATVVVFDHDLTPRQLRNLEGATDAEVLDRSSVILHIFQRHARSREARLQVEIARLKYLAPRLRATGVKQDRGQGGIGGRGGAGETSVELDRRRVRDRIVELSHELEGVEREAKVRRDRRGGQRMVALVGYTNAGKSTLMRALTGAEVLVQDRLFATLDTTVRVLHPKTTPRTLVSDTVGFIERLPHDLVASFRSTLAEAREADLLLHVVDASDEAREGHLRVTEEVLTELGAADRPALRVFNKVDRMDPTARAELAAEHPDGILVSAFDASDVASLRERIVKHLERDMVDAELFVSYLAPRGLHEIHEQARVLEEEHGETGTRVVIRAPAEVVDRLRSAGQ